MENHPDLQADAEMYGKAIGHYKKCPLHSYGPKLPARGLLECTRFKLHMKFIRVLACVERHTSGIVFASSSFIKKIVIVLFSDFLKKLKLFL